MTQGDLRTHFDPTPGDGPLKAHCLYHEADDTPSLAIYPNGVFCFACSAHRCPEAFLHDLKVQGIEKLDTTRSAGRRKTAGEAKPIPVSMVTTFHQWLVNGPYQDRLDWFYARGIRLEAIQANYLGHSGQAFVIPVWNDDGQVAGLRFRRDDEYGSGPKYYGTRGANAAQLYPPAVLGGDPDRGGVYLCEGELDAIRLSQEGLQAYSMTNGCSAFKPEHVSLLPGAMLVHVVYDQDDAGRKAADKVVRLLGDRARAVHWPAALGKDVSEFLVRWSLKAFEDYVERAWE